MEETKYYTGIGSRNTPDPVLKQMERIAKRLSNRYVLRSGGADGADTAFEKGCGQGPKEIYLPWPEFNGHDSSLNQPSPEAFKLVDKYHPSPHRLTKWARALHARNAHQILGKYLDVPSTFVICWHNGSGGTLQAIRIAEDYKIPIYNLRDINDAKERSKNTKFDVEGTFF